MSNVIGPAEQNDQKISDALATLCIPPRAIMHVEVFRVKFLPFFSLKGLPKEDIDKMLDLMSRRTGAKHTEKDLIGNMINEWILEVKNPYLKVDVIDDNRKVLYTIPPIFDQTRDAVKQTDQSIVRLIEQVGHQARVHEKLGERYMHSAVLPLIDNPHYSLEYFEMWNKVFAANNLPLYDLSAVGGKNETAETPTSDVSDGIPAVDEFEDDGF